MVRLFRVFVPTSVVALLVSEIVLLFSCYTLSAFLVLDVDPEVFLFYDGGMLNISLVVGSILFGLYFQDLYTHFRIRSRILLLQQLCLVIGIAFLAQAALNYINPGSLLPRWLMMLGSGMVLLVLPVWRILYSAVVVRAVGAQRVLFLGTSAVAREIAQRIEERPELGLANIGYVDDEVEGGEALPGGRLLGPLQSLREVVERQQPDRIIVGLTERRQRLPVYDLLELRFAGIHIEEAASAYEAAFTRISTRELRPSELVFTAELGPRPNRVALQSFYSFVIAVVATVATLPLTVLVALAVKLSSRGPVLYRQTRVGKNDVPFVLYKFRSMRADAEADTGAVWATPDDPRITPLGRWLRQLRLDELPQLFNVLRGEMSLVGPRPERPEFVRTLSEQIPYYRQRHCVKPGVTGWAQINHKYGDTIEDVIMKLEYDLYYIKHLAPALDAYILFHTAKVMLLSRGAQ